MAIANLWPPFFPWYEPASEVALAPAWVEDSGERVDAWWPRSAAAAG
jgi:hypothetical protein